MRADTIHLRQGMHHRYRACQFCTRFQHSWCLSFLSSLGLFEVPSDQIPIWAGRRWSVCDLSLPLSCSLWCRRDRNYLRQAQTSTHVNAVIELAILTRISPGRPNARRGCRVVSRCARKVLCPHKEPATMICIFCAISCIIALNNCRWRIRGFLFAAVHTCDHLPGPRRPDGHIYNVCGRLIAGAAVCCILP